MNIYNIINDLHISVGESKRINCPSCNGYKTFTVTNNMGRLVWNCYKSSCPISGTKKVNLSVDDIKTVKLDVQKDSTGFALPEYVVQHNHRREVMDFCELWNLECDKLELYYDNKKKGELYFLYKER